LIGKIKDAPQGYSGFFDAVKVNEKTTSLVYDFDADMLANAEAIDADVDALQQAVRRGRRDKRSASAISTPPSRMRTRPSASGMKS
jgi:hypothetical protein